MTLPGGSGSQREVAAPIVAVTGATGFVGGHVCAELLEHGYGVLGLVRGAAPLPSRVQRAPISYDDARSLDVALKGVHTVIHLAARAHVMDERGANLEQVYRDANVKATIALLDSSFRAGVRRFVFASSVKAVGESNRSAWNESTTPRPVDPYGRSKLEAETIIAEQCRREGVSATTLRLPLVYGPGVRGNVLRLFRLVELGIPLPFGGLTNRRSMLYVGNAARAFRLAAELETASPKVFFVSDGTDLSTPELLALAGESIGRRVRLLPLPRPLLALGGVGDGARNSLAPKRLQDALQRLAGSLTVDARAFVSATGFRPPFSPREGLLATGAWYLKRAKA